jgi:hypothetical protein
MGWHKNWSITQNFKYTHIPTHLVVAVGVAEVIDDLRADARLLPSPLMFETCWCSGALAFTAGS